MYIKDTNNFLSKCASLPPFILYTIEVPGIYPSISHDEKLIAIKKSLYLRKDKRTPTESVIELAEYVLKNNIFELNFSFYKQLRGTLIGTKMAPK